MTDGTVRKELQPNDLLFNPIIKIDSQGCLAGSICIEAGPTKEGEMRGVISISIGSNGAPVKVYLLPRHAQELATTLLAIASKLDELPAQEKGQVRD